MTGPVALLAICVTTAAVGIAVASWGFARRGSDAALAASMSGLAYLFLPVHALGWLGWLTRGSLTTALAALAVAVIAPTLAWSAARARWIDTARVIARAGVDAVREPIDLGASPAWASSRSSP